MTAGLRVAALRGAALFQDSGRTHRASGVPGSGAFDRFAHAAATRLVGGQPAQASVEVVGGIDVVACLPVTCAVTGTGGAAVDGWPAPTWTAFDLDVGQSLAIDATARAYLAVGGGFRPPEVLGSRSTCLLGPIGPAAIRAGDPLAVDPGSCRSVTAGDFCRPAPVRGPIRVVPGPDGWDPTCRVRVVEVSRIGVRVRPARAGAAATGLPSMGVLPGTIQVLPSGDWMVLGPDAGTMGGYPVAGVVASVDLDRWAQVVPGEVVSLVAADAAGLPEPSDPEVVRVRRMPG